MKLLHERVIKLGLALYGGLIVGWAIKALLFYLR